TARLFLFRVLRSCCYRHRSATGWDIPPAWGRSRCRLARELSSSLVPSRGSPLLGCVGLSAKRGCQQPGFPSDNRCGLSFLLWLTSRRRHQPCLSGAGCLKIPPRWLPVLHQCLLVV